jgi:tetratricopeptide (TPR) repeat protein
MLQETQVVRTSLTVEIPKSILIEEELALVSAALEQNPGSRRLRVTQAKLLQRQARLGEASAILSALAQEQQEEHIMLSLALIHLAHETAADDAQAAKAAKQAIALAQTDDGRANALATLGKAQVRLQDHASAEACFIEALDLNPHHKDAFKRLAALMLKADRTEALLQRIEHLQKLNVGHSRLFGALGLALLRHGQMEDARHIFGVDTLLHRTTLVPPQGWSSLSAFNEAIVAEMSAHPSLRFESPGAASRKTWRVDNPATSRSEVIPQLQTCILEEITRYIDTMALLDHPWVRARPKAAELHNWCVMTDGEGYEEWHVRHDRW